ncbi:ribonuclease H [Actinomycetaceae bacterium L2_0104]
MTDWLPTNELASRFGLDSFDLLDALAKLGLAAGPRPTPLAEAHGFSSSGLNDAGRLEALWHPDVCRLLQGVGLMLLPVSSRFDQESLFGNDDAAGFSGPEPAFFAASSDAEVLADEEGVTASEGEPARASIQAASDPVGKIRPGFERIVATDGACSGNPGPGGWAWVEQRSGARGSGGAARTTNNIMELTALIEALEFVGPGPSLLIRCDSQYVINTVTKWAPNWRRKGWKKADGQPVKNRELVERLLNLYEGREGRTEVEWVKGHAGDAANELCDRLAVAEARKFSR